MDLHALRNEGSPVATGPTWSRLRGAHRRVLADDGRPIWHELLAALRPNVVVLSVAKNHLKHIAFKPLEPWKTIHQDPLPEPPATYGAIASDPARMAFSRPARSLLEVMPTPTRWGAGGAGVLRGHCGL